MNREQTSSLAAAALLICAIAFPAQAQKRGGSLTYTYFPEPTSLSTIATTAVPVSLIATKIYDSLHFDWHGRRPRVFAGA